MKKPDFTLEFIKEQTALTRLGQTLPAISAFALDIETVDWWNRERERIALVQIAFRQPPNVKVVIIDALARLDFEPLRFSMENDSTVKIIHNAGFDAVRINKHYDFRVAPVFDTMLAARRSGERKYSLKAQAQAHLDLGMDKSAQKSDWSLRPLNLRQLSYAALDPYATLLLYEYQRTRNLSGAYWSKADFSAAQNSLPLEDFAAPSIEISAAETPANENILSKTAAALLGIITELPTRFSPLSLAASLDLENRSGLAGWIINRRLGADTELDEETIKIAVADLCAGKLARINETRRLEPTGKGADLWRSLKIENNF